MKTNIGVLGSSNASKENIAIAEDVGREIAKADAVLICGGREGIMDAAAKGCSSAGGLSIGILPSLDKSEGNKHLGVALPTSLGFGRNIFIASASDVVIAIDGNYGTMSEISFALNYGRPVVVIKGTCGTADYLADGPFDVSVAQDAKEAVKLALNLIK